MLDHNFFFRLKALMVGLSDLANKNTRHVIKFEYQINNKYGMGILMLKNWFCLSDIQIKLSMLSDSWPVFHFDGDIG